MIYSISPRAISGRGPGFGFWLSISILALPLLCGPSAPARAARQPAQIVAVSAASFERDRAVAPGSIIAAFTSGVLPPGLLLIGSDTDPSTPQIELPQRLGDLSVEIHGHRAGIFAIAGTPGFDQFNLLVPDDLDEGRGPIVIRDREGSILAAGEIEIAPVVPGIFTAANNGEGVPAAQIVRVRTDGTQVIEPVAEFDATLGRHVPRPIDLGPEGEQVFLVLYLTGIDEISNRIHTRILLGGTEYIPDFVGPAPGFVGLDQVNFRLPRSIRGRLSLAFTALGFGTSKVLNLEIAALADTPSDIPPPAISSLSRTETQAGEILEIYGSGFAPDADVLFIDADRRSYNAQIIEVSPTLLRVLVPFGAGSGQVAVSTEGGEARHAITLRTTLSGIIQRADRQPSGAYRRVGVRDLAVRAAVPGGERTSFTNDDGAFLLAGLPQSGLLTFYVDGDSRGVLPGINVPYKMPVRAGRDNQFPGYVEVKAPGGQTIPATGGGRLPDRAFVIEEAIEGKRVVVEPRGSRIRTAKRVQGSEQDEDGELTVTVLDPGRVPANLPAGHFSTTIVQITPIGVEIDPGLKLTFPNTDRLPAGTEVSLFQYEVRPDDAEIGEFVEIGKARVSSDGERIETEDNAAKIGSYYFVSIRRPTVTLYGSVIEEDGDAARGALVQVHGQSAFSHTDDNGAFILPDVPFIEGFELALEVSYLRPDGTVERAERVVGDLSAGDLRFVSPAIVLPGTGRRRAPIIIAPRSLTVEAGEAADFALFVYELRATGPLQSVTVAGAQFASIAEDGAKGGAGEGAEEGTSEGSSRYRLLLAPEAGDAGSYRLRVTATDAEGLMTSEEIALEVREGDGRPLALSRSLLTDEDTAVGVRLAARAGHLFRITSLPEHGRIVGVPPELTYIPDEHFHGADRFSFVASNGLIESAPAEVTIVVRPINDVPQEEVAKAHQATVGERLVIVINGSDIDSGQALALEAVSLPQGARIIQHTATSWTLEWTPRADQIGTHRAVLRLSDDHLPPHVSLIEIEITVEEE